MKHAWRWPVGLGALVGAGTLVLGAPLLALGGAAGAGTVAAAGTAASGRPAVAVRAEVAIPPAPAWKAPSGILTLGMHGSAVRSLQKRLAALKFYPGTVDGQFGLDTLEAVWAFKEIQGLPVTGANQDQVSRRTEYRLEHPRGFKALVPKGGKERIEVNMRDETLVLYKNNKPVLFSHVSTGAGCLAGQGCGWITPDGNYKSIWFYKGWIKVPLGEMYNPVFFIGSVFAIHGEDNSAVPFYPDSHGCVRIPYDVASFFHTLIKVPGTPIYIRG
jgi:Putative peptidoglycan binding domain/L,D-transpeptidase catalytic domain